MTFAIVFCMGQKTPHTGGRTSELVLTICKKISRESFRYVLGEHNSPLGTPFQDVTFIISNDIPS